MFLLLVLACWDAAGPPAPPEDTGATATCVDALQMTAPAVAGTDPAGLRYCWSDDPYEPRWDRTGDPACTSDPGAFLDECAESDPDAPCAVDADCGTGQCTYDGWSSCMCVDTCVTSADCGAGETCLCAAGYETPGGAILSPQAWSQCRPAECTSDAECAGEPCTLSRDNCRQPEGFYCHTAADECRYDSDCTGASEFCRRDPDQGVWVCTEGADCE